MYKDSLCLHKNASRRTSFKCFSKAGYIKAQQKTADVANSMANPFLRVTDQKGRYFIYSGWKI